MVSTTSVRRSGQEALAAGLNLAVVLGVVSSEPTSRMLPSGDEVHSYEVTVREEGVAAATVPVVLVGAAPPKGVGAGDAVLVVGRVRRRFFRAGGATASRTELVADRIVPLRRRAGVAAAVVAARERLGVLAVDGRAAIA